MNVLCILFNISVINSTIKLNFKLRKKIFIKAIYGDTVLHFIHTYIFPSDEMTLFQNGPSNYSVCFISIFLFCRYFMFFIAKRVCDVHNQQIGII